MVALSMILTFKKGLKKKKYFFHTSMAPQSWGFSSSSRSVDLPNYSRKCTKNVKCPSEVMCSPISTTPIGNGLRKCILNVIGLSMGVQCLRVALLGLTRCTVSRKSRRKKDYVKAYTRWRWWTWILHKATCGVEEVFIDVYIDREIGHKNIFFFIFDFFC